MAASATGIRHPEAALLLAGVVLVSGCASDYRRDGLSVHEFAAVDRVAVYERGDGPPLDYQILDMVQGVSCGFSLVPEGHPAYKEVTEYEALYDMKLEAADLGANALVDVDCRRYYRGFTDRCNEAILCEAEAARLDDGVGMDFPPGGTRALAPATDSDTARARYRPPMGFVPDYLTERQRAGLGRVGIGSPAARPGKTVHAPPTSKTAALQGAGMWALQCIGQGGTIGLVASPLCAAIGASLGALSGETEESIATSTDAIGAALEEYYHHGALRSRVERMTRDGTTQSLMRRVVSAPAVDERQFENDVDTVIEVAVEELLLPAWRDGGIVNLPSPISLRARVRVVSPADGAEVYNRAYGYTSEERRYAEWGAENAAAVRHALDRGFEQLAERIVGDLFVAYPLMPGFGAPRARGGGGPRVYVVVPVDPPAHRHAGYRRPAPVRVPSLEPRFRWKDFPGEAVLRADFQGKLARLSNLRYDLRIYRLDPERRTSRLVHERVGLTDTEFRMAQPLAPATEYAWTVRARFDLDTGERATRWSGDWLGGGVKGFLIRTP